MCALFADTDAAGMERGDIDYAFQAAGAFLTLSWYGGVSYAIFKITHINRRIEQSLP